MLKRIKDTLNHMIAKRNAKILQKNLNDVRLVYDTDVVRGLTSEQKFCESIWNAGYHLECYIDYEVGTMVISAIQSTEGYPKRCVKVYPCIGTTGDKLYGPPYMKEVPNFLYD